MRPARRLLVRRRLVELWLPLVVLAACGWPRTGFAEAPVGDERREIEMLIGAYYRAVADEAVDEVVGLYHCRNSFERDKITALVEQAFAIADSEFDSVRVQSIDLYPERNIGVARVGVDYRIRRFDGGEAVNGHLDAAVVLLRGTVGWRVGKVARAADLDLTAAVSRFDELSRELEASVPTAPPGGPEPLLVTTETAYLAASPDPAIESPPPAAGTVTALPIAVPGAGGLTFFAVRQKASGQCVVVAGIEGIAPGDTIFGEFSEYRRAEEAVVRKCIGE
jgi:hypothetical protein